MRLMLLVAAVLLPWAPAAAQDVQIASHFSHSERCSAAKSGDLLHVQCSHHYYVALWQQGSSTVGYFRGTGPEGRHHLILPGSDRIELIPDPKDAGAPAEAPGYS